MKLLSKAALVLVASLAAGCSSSPVYKVNYDYTVPTEAGSCVAQCQSAHMACEANRIDEQKLDNRQCVQREHSEYRRCLDTLAAGSKASCSIDLTACQQSWVDYGQCVDMYNQCYQACGGEVVEKRRCVQGCQSNQ